MTAEEAAYLKSIGMAPDGTDASAATERAPDQEVPFTDRLASAAKKLGKDVLTNLATNIRPGRMGPVMTGAGAKKLAANPWGELAQAGKTLDYGGGLVRTGLMDAGGRLAGNGPMPKGDWENAVLGSPKSGDALLGDRLHMDPGLMRSTLGFGLEMLGPAGAAKGVSKLLGAPAKGLIAKGLEGGGKRMYRQWMKQADAHLAEEFRDSIGKTAGEHAVSDLMWNDGKPQLTAWSLSGLKKQYKDVLKSIRQKYAAIHDVPHDPVDLAPGLSAVGDAAEAEARQAAIAEAKQAANIAPVKDPLTGGITPGSVDPEAMKLVALMESGKHQGVEAAAKAAGSKYKDEIVAKLYDALQDPSTRAEAGERLKAFLHPKFSPLIDEHVAKYATGNQEAANNFFRTIIANSMEGKRTIKQLDELGRTFGSRAAGSANSSLTPSAYKEGRRMSPGVVSDMGTKAKLNDVLMDTVQEAAGDGATEMFKAERRKYGIGARGLPKIIDALKRAAGRPVVTAGDGVVTQLGGLQGLLLKRAPQLLFGNSPIISTQVGRGLNTLSKTNIWDLMAGQGLLMNTRDGEQK